jgi:hypothetical protein
VWVAKYHVTLDLSLVYVRDAARTIEDVRQQLCGEGAVLDEARDETTVTFTAEMTEVSEWALAHRYFGMVDELSASGYPLQILEGDEPHRRVVS